MSIPRTMAQAFESACRAEPRPRGRSSIKPREWPALALRTTAGCLLLSLASAALAIVNPVFTRLTTGDGLSQSNITALAQDQVGFVWIGTQEGLNRFDGRSMQSFLAGPAPGSLSHDYITDLLVDAEGQIWVATLRGGINRFNEADQAFEPFQGFEGAPFEIADTRALHQAQDGTIWIGTDSQGLYRVDLSEQTLTTYRADETDSTRLSSDNIRAIVSDPQGRLWIGTQGGGLNRFDEETERFERFRHSTVAEDTLSSDEIMSLHAASDGTIWVGTYDDGLNILNPFQRTVSRLDHDPEDFEGVGADRIRDIMSDDLGRVWVATDHGLDLWNPDTRSFHHFRNEAGEARSLSDDRVITLMQDRGGVLWVGTYNGLNTWNARVGSIEHIRMQSNARATISSNVITSFAEEPGGDVLIGTWGGGLNRMNEAASDFEAWRADGQSGSLSDDRVMAVHVDRRGRWWVGTMGAGLNRRDPGSSAFIQYRHEPGEARSLSFDAITGIFEDASGQIWATTYGGGANRFDESGFERFLHDPDDPSTIASNRVLDLAQSPDGRLWFATDGGGLSIFDPSDGAWTHLTTADGLGSDAVVVLLFTERDLWIGTKDAGVNRLSLAAYRRGEFEFSQVTRSEGLPSNSIMGLLADDSGLIWIATNRGISALAPEVASIRSFTTENGLQGEDFNSGAFAATADGMLYFGGNNGFNRFNPRNLLASTNNHHAPIALNSVSVLGEPLRTDSAPYRLERLDLQHDDRVVTFDFVALDFTNAEKNRYRYRLSGLEERWTDAGTSSRATYTNLPAGSFVFEAQAANNDGLWSNQVLSLAVNVEPPPWATPGARAVQFMVALAILLMIYLSVSRRIRRRSEAAADERMRLYVHCLEEASDAVAIAQPDGQIIYSNRAFTDLVGERAEKDSLGGGLFLDEVESDQALTMAREAGQWHGEIKPSHDSTLDVNLTGVQRTPEGSGAIIAVARDISELKLTEQNLGRYRDRLELLVHKRTLELEAEIEQRRESEQQVRVSLREKELLLKEVHHRVKNNMQVISSLLNLQAQASTIPELARALGESQNRIRSMALIHESLYRSDNFLEIAFSEYLRELTATLVRAYSIPGVEVVIDVAADGVALDIDTAVPCGLIVNELVSNSLKHGYPDYSGQAHIRISISKEESEYLLSVTDNGVGFPDDVDFRDTQSLGMEIVCVLTSQLHGDINLVRGDGTRFEIRFPAEAKEPAYG